MQHIIGELEAGRLAPGDRVNAARIAQTLGLSAAPVREALGVLAGRGVVLLLPDRGAVMRPMSLDDILQLWEVFARLCPLGLELAAAAVAKGADTTVLNECQERIQSHLSSEAPLDLLIKLNDWHFAANELGGNPFVSVALERLGLIYWDHYIARWIDISTNLDKYKTNYRRMHEALLVGDSAGIAGILKFHVDWSVSLIREAAASMPKVRRRRRPRTE
jgi:DNA-binding GntR family transcriptional regulator